MTKNGIKLFFCVLVSMFVAVSCVKNTETITDSVRVCVKDNPFIAYREYKPGEEANSYPGLKWVFKRSSFKCVNGKPQ